MCGVGGFWEKSLLPFITIATAIARRVYTFAILSLYICIFTSIMERTIYQYSRIWSKNNGCTILLSLICEALLLPLGTPPLPQATWTWLREQQPVCAPRYLPGTAYKNNGNHCIRQPFDTGLDLKSWISMCEQSESHIFANTSINLQLGPVCRYCTLCHTSCGSMFKPQKLIAVWDSQQMNNPLHRQVTFITSCATRFRSIRAVLRRLLELWLSPVSFSLATLRRFSGNTSGNWQVQTSIHKDI